MQAAQVTAGAAADPGAETELLQVAARDGMRALREESQRVITASCDEDAERTRVRRERHLGARTEGLATRGWFSGPTEEVAELLAALEPLEQHAFDAARRRGSTRLPAHSASTRSSRWPGAPHRPVTPSPPTPRTGTGVATPWLRHPLESRAGRSGTVVVGQWVVRYRDAGRTRGDE